MKQLSLAVFLSLVASASWADALAVKAGVSAWWAEGKASEVSENAQQQWSANAAFEHPIPLIPNVKLRYWGYSEDGVSGMELTTIDVIAYYEILDNAAIDLDIGIAASNFQDGQVGSGRRFEGWVPQVYGAVRVPLPPSGFGIYGEGTGTSFDDTTAYDIEGGVDYLLDMPVIDLSLRLGYREVENDFDGFDKFSGKLEFSGWTFGVLLDI